MRRLALLTLASALLASTLARAEPACLPKAMFSKEAIPEMSLGLVDGVPTLCAQDDWRSTTVFGCWRVHPKSGALTAAAPIWPAGLSRRVTLDPTGCFEGYCLNADPDSLREALLAFVMSTDGKHAAILNAYELHIFDAQSKTKDRTISLSWEHAEPEKGIGNMPIRMIYAGDTIYVTGTDAGPFMAVWAFRDDGARLGRINQSLKPDSEALDVYGGTVNLVDGKHVALAESGARSMLLLSLGSGERTVLKRSVGSGPCSRENMQDIKLGDFERLPRACKRFAQINYEPYFHISPIRLPSGDFLTTLGGPMLGSMAVLDGRTLVEKARMKLRRCT